MGFRTMKVVAVSTLAPLADIDMWRICSSGLNFATKIANVGGTTNMSASRQYCRVAGLVPTPASAISPSAGAICHSSYKTDPASCTAQSTSTTVVSKVLNDIVPLWFTIVTQ